MNLGVDHRSARNAADARHPQDTSGGPAVAGVLTTAGPSPDEVQIARAQEYRLISALLARAPSAGLLEAIAGLEDDGTELGAAHGALALAAAEIDARAVERAYFDLFIGVGRGELLPYASYYLTGFLNERPLAAVRRDLAWLGRERSEGLHDPEDHIAILADVMAALALGEGGGGPDEAAFFRRHLEPWAPRLFADLAATGRSAFFRAVGRLGAAFIAVESSAFALDAVPGGDASRPIRN